MQCCASWGLPNGEREREEWTASEWQPCSGGEAAARENVSPRVPQLFTALRGEGALAVRPPAPPAAPTCARPPTPVHPGPRPCLQDWQHLQQQWQAQQQQQQPPRAEAERPCSSGRPYEEPEQQAEEFFVPPWPASLAGGGAADGYHPLEFYPTSKFDLEWGNALQLDGNGGISKEHGKVRQPDGRGRRAGRRARSVRCRCCAHVPGAAQSHPVHAALGSGVVPPALALDPLLRSLPCRSM